MSIGATKIASTLVLNGRTITDFYEDTIVDISFPNPKHLRKRTATHVVKSKNIKGDEAELTLTIVRASNDDIFLTQIEESDDFVSGTFARKYKRSDGTIVTNSYKLTQGHISTVGNVTEQLEDENAESQYVIQCRAVKGA